ncbi:MAG: hypothetical protein ACTSSP_10025 [Candidatus Asgardarchaeia archaeon]
MPNKRLTTKEFIRKSKAVHGDKYDYREAEYVRARDKVKIYCNKHGYFFYQRAFYHLNGGGCGHCARTAASTTKYFIENAKKMHGDEYDYSRVEYKSSNKKVVIICKIHGEFKQVPYAHLYGQGCPDCGLIKNPLPRIERSEKKFIKEVSQIHGDRYDYSRMHYDGFHKYIDIGCKIHGIFKQTPDNHLKGKGCPDCGKIEQARKSKERRLTQEEFVEKASQVHKNKYDYSKTRYITHYHKVIVTCPKHGDYETTANNHLRDHGCPHCRYKKEGKVKEFLLEYFDDWKIVPNKRIWDRYRHYHHKRYCDFWLEKKDIKMIVEYDGEQHFKPVSFNGISIKKAQKQFKRQQIVDKLDAMFCKEKGIILYRIRYDENIEKSIIKLKEEIEIL